MDFFPGKKGHFATKKRALPPPPGPPGSYAAAVHTCVPWRTCRVSWGGGALHPPRCAELASTLNDLCVLSQISQNEVLRPIFTRETFPRAENVPKISLLKVEILCRPITFYKILSGNGPYGTKQQWWKACSALFLNLGKVIYAKKT